MTNTDDNTYDDPDRGAPQRVVIKFYEGTVGRYADGLQRRLAEVDEGLANYWQDLTNEFEGITIQRLFRGLGNANDEEDGLAPLRTFYEVLLPPEREEALRIGLRIAEGLNRYGGPIEFAYVPGPPAPPPQNGCMGAPRAYLDAAPDGLGISGYTPPNGGSRPRVVVMDKVWNWQEGAHPALHRVQTNAAFLGPTRAAYPGNFDNDAAHATAALGLLGARTAGGLDCDGIAVNAVIAFASSHIRVNGRWVEAIASRIESVTDPARNMMGAGDILLLELQMTGSTIFSCGVQPPPPNQSCYTPVDVDPDVHAAILAATNVRGIIVIAAAGNGGTDIADMRTYTMCDWYPQLATASGAILVAACDMPGGNGAHNRRPDSNYGDRAACYAWGDQLVTLDAGNSANLRADFGATSGASALVAGVAALLQHAATLAPPVGLGRRLSIAEMEGGLTYVAAGQAQPAAGQQIGVMPNLAKMIGVYLATL